MYDLWKTILYMMYRVKRVHKFLQQDDVSLVIDSSFNLD